MEKDYTEIGEQIFNLVDNDRDKAQEFYDALSVADTRSAVSKWIEDNVRREELEDLYKDGQSTEGFLDWVSGSSGNSYFMDTDFEIDGQNIDTVRPRAESRPSDAVLASDIEKEDEEIMSPEERRIGSQMADGEYRSDDIDNDDEIEMALRALDDSSEDDDGEDVGVVFDIIDDSSEDDGEEEPGYDSSEDDGEDDGSDDTVHKRRIHLDHHVNKVVEEIDDEERIDRRVHKKYYVMKKPELGSTENLDSLEDELDRHGISYYDFGKDDTIAIKIYTQNEVELNRIFEHLGFEDRCVDIAHYTDDWYSQPQPRRKDK